MAANYIVINSKFRPFSYAEMLQPVQMATAAHQDIENQYAELATKANIWEEMANEQTDPYAYKMYKTYSNDLERQANQLAREGLTPASRQNMLKMRQRYSSDIVPIEQAYKRRQELVDEQRKLLAQDNTLMFDRNASMLSLDDLIKNPQLTYQSYSGALLAKQVGTAAQNLAKEMRENPRKWDSILHGQYFETMMRRGYTPEEIILASAKDPNAPKELKDIIENTITSSNISSWKDKTILDRAYDYAIQGLWNAIGDIQYQNLQNRGWQPVLGDGENNEDIIINPINLYSSKEKTEIQNNLSEFSKYFDIDENGTIKMNKAGLDAYNEKKYNPGTKAYAGYPEYYKAQPSNFKKFIDSIGGSKYIMEGKMQDKELGQLWLQYNKEHQLDKYDARKYTEFSYAISDSQQQEMKDFILKATKGVPLKEVDFDNKNEEFKDTGEELDIKDFNTKDYTLLETLPSFYGTTMLIKDKNGNIKRYRMPYEGNRHEENRDRWLEFAHYLTSIRNGGNIEFPDGSVKYVTPEQVEREYEKSLKKAIRFHSQIGITNKIEEQKHNPYNY